MSLSKKIISGGLWLTLFNYSNYFINFVGHIILARLLLPEHFGIFSMGLAVANFVFIFFNFSFRSAALHLQKEKDIFETALVFAVIFGVLIVFAGGIVAFLTSYFISSQSALVVFFLSVSQFFMLVSSIYSSLQEKEFLFQRNAFVRFITSSLATILAVLAAFLGFGLWSLIFQQVLTAIFLYFGMKIASPIKIKFYFNPRVARKLWSYAWRSLLANVFGILNSQTPFFFIGVFGSYFLGLFSQAFYLANIPARLFSPFFQNIFFPVYAKIQDQKEKTTRGLNWSTILLTRVLIFGSVVVFFYHREIVQILLGNKWIKASPLFKWFFLFMFFHSLFSNFSSFLLANGKVSKVIKARFYQTVFLYSFLIFLLVLKSPGFLPIIFGLGMFLSFFIVFKEVLKQDIFVDFKKCFYLPFFYGVVLVSFNFFSVFYFSQWILRIILTLVLFLFLVIIFDRKEIKNFINQIKL